MYKNHGLFIGLNGKMGCGKTTVADYLVREHGFVALSFADPLKMCVRDAFGLRDEQVWGEEKRLNDDFWGLSPGTLLQLVGTQLFRDGLAELMPDIFGKKDIWLRRLLKDVDTLRAKNPGQNIVIPDVRFPNEGDLVKTRGTLIRIERTVSPSDGRDPNHPSEISMDSYESFDYTLGNDKTISELLNVHVHAILVQLVAAVRTT